MVTEFFDHHAAYTAVRISIELPSSPEPKYVTGTGFFYLATVNLGDKDTRKKLLLISNKHILQHGSVGKITLKLNSKREDGTPNYGVLRVFRIRRFTELYTAHPNKDVDLACVDVSYITHSDAYVRYLDKGFLTPIDYTRVAPGSSILFVGYPNDYYDTANNLPLVRKGTLASMPNIDFKGRGLLVVDALVFSGSSGSPVFVDWDDKYRLLGVIKGTMEGRTPSGYPAVLGLGIVIKQTHVQELVDYTVDRVQQAWHTAIGKP